MTLAVVLLVVAVVVGFGGNVVLKAKYDEAYRSAARLGAENSRLAAQNENLRIRLQMRPVALPPGLTPLAVEEAAAGGAGTAVTSPDGPDGESQPHPSLSRSAGTQTGPKNETSPGGTPGSVPCSAIHRAGPATDARRPG
jgi:hypothetical protein